MRILVVGGAGYIGSHMVKYLGKKHCDVIVFDNLSSGHADAVLNGELVVGDLADIPALEALFSANKFDAVMHFASSILVGESVTNPAKYFRNNVINTINLLDVMLKYNVMHFVFSSTAAIFGEPVYTPINEAHPKNPINPYGKSKLMVEDLLEDYDTAYGFKAVCLRYFNAAGADPDGQLGERHDPETHLIPLVLQAASGKREGISVFGRDYETDDGTCVRDYIHINDLCEAHWLSLNSLISNKQSKRYNLGNGKGFSVQQVINQCKEVSASAIHVIEGQRRDGDPAVLVADASLIHKELGWNPEFPKLETIIKHAWTWEQNLEG